MKGKCRLKNWSEKTKLLSVQHWRRWWWWWWWQWRGQGEDSEKWKVKVRFSPCCLSREQQTRRHIDNWVKIMAITGGKRNECAALHCSVLVYCVFQFNCCFIIVINRGSISLARTRLECWLIICSRQEQLAFSGELWGFLPYPPLGSSSSSRNNNNNAQFHSRLVIIALAAAATATIKHTELPKVHRRGESTGILPFITDNSLAGN